MTQTAEPRKIEIVEPQYPALMFMVRHGHPLAALCGIFVFLAGLWFVREGIVAVVALVPAALAGLIVYFLLRVCWDIARLVADTLVPQ